MILRKNQQWGMGFFAIGIFGGIFLCSVTVAQMKSYESRLSEIANQKSNLELGTMSGQDKNELRKKELFHLYAYEPAKPSEAVRQEKVTTEYVEFRKKHNVPEYIGDDAVKDVIRKTKDDKVKEEVVKIVEAEKLLYDSYSTFHQEKERTEVIKGTLRSAGMKETNKNGEKDMATRIDILGRQTSSVLKSSLEKLVEANAIGTESMQGNQYMASGGRVFPKLNLEEDKELLNLRSQVLVKVQRELLTVMANAINLQYHKEQGDTAKEDIKNKDQLLAFVRTVPPAQQAERAQEIKTFVRQWAGKSLEKREGQITFSDAEIDHLVEEILNMQRTADGDKFNSQKLQQLFQNRTPDQTQALTKLGTDPSHFTPGETKSLNQQFIQSEKSGMSADMFRPGVDPHRLTAEERKEFDASMKKWSEERGTDRSSPVNFGNPNAPAGSSWTGPDNTPGGPPCSYMCDAPAN